MNWIHPDGPLIAGRFSVLWERGVRLFARMSIAFALSAVAAIGIGSVVSDNVFAQILIIILSTLALWGPFFLVIVRFHRWFARRNRERALELPGQTTNSADNEIWRRLMAAAPSNSQRLMAIKRSLEKSRETMVNAKLDPDANELCILIDRRLPELIDRKLEVLPPDDRNRQHEIGELIDLIEQFARHCSSREMKAEVDASFEAEVLRRRFEARLTEF